MNIYYVKNIYSSEPYRYRKVAYEDLLKVSGIVVIGELLYISLSVACGGFYVLRSGNQAVRSPLTYCLSSM